MISYTLKKDETDEYILKTLRCGVCPALLKGSYYDDGVSFQICCDDTNTKNIKTGIEYSPQVVLGAFKNVLKAAVSVIESCIVLNSYLIPAKSVSFDYKDIYVDDTCKARLLIKPCGVSDFTEGIVFFCNSVKSDFPDSNAAEISERLLAESGQSNPDLKGMLKFLGRWLDELR